MFLRFSYWKLHRKSTNSFFFPKHELISIFFVLHHSRELFAACSHNKTEQLNYVKIVKNLEFHIAHFLRNFARPSIIFHCHFLIRGRGPAVQVSGHAEKPLLLPEPIPDNITGIRIYIFKILLFTSHRRYRKTCWRPYYWRRQFKFYPVDSFNFGNFTPEKRDAFYYVIFILKTKNYFWKIDSIIGKHVLVI